MTEVPSNSDAAQSNTRGFGLRIGIGVLFWIAGLGALYAYVNGGQTWALIAAAIGLLGVACIAEGTIASIFAAILALLVPVYLMTRAGPLWSFSAEEWAWFIALAFLLFICLGWTGALWRFRSKIFASLFGLVTAFSIPVMAMGIATYISPVVTTSQYVAVEDGTRIAVDVYLPRDLPAGEKIPTVIHLTRYHRNTAWRFPYSLQVPPYRPNANRLTAAGIAWVTVDLRGSGASEGHRDIAFSDAEIQDGRRILDWITAQPWSDGNVVSEGGSYVGTAAENLLSLNHPAVKGAMPTWSLYDPYRDIIWPGGLFLNDFVDSWTEINKTLDANLVQTFSEAMARMSKGVRPVDEDRNGKMLEDIVSRRDNYLPADLFPYFESIDDQVDGKSVRGMSAWGRHEQIAASDTPMFMVSGWYDGAYPNGSIKRWLNIAHPDSRLLLGSWDHGGRQTPSPCQDDPGLEPFDYFGELIEFVRHVAWGQATSYSRRSPVSYFTMCGKGWQSADQWPPAGLSEMRFYLSGNGTLTEEITTRGSRRYQVDFEATSTEGYSRWFSYTNRGGLPIGYPDRTERGKQLLVYDSAPLPNGLEVTGHPVINLSISANASDAAVFVYLEDVGPEGDVRYITEGQLRAAHRKISEQPLPFKQIGVNRSFKRDDMQFLTPGEPTQLKFELLPVSYFIRPGRSVRISIAGADKDNFRLPENTASEFEVFSGGESGSHVVLPVAR